MGSRGHNENAQNQSTYLIFNISTHFTTASPSPIHLMISSLNTSSHKQSVHFSKFNIIYEYIEKKQI